MFILKKDSPNSKKNYRPISILPTTLKIFDRIIFNQLHTFIYHLLSPFLCGFFKGFGRQYALIRYIEDLKQCLDGKKNVGTVLMDLSKAFDCLSHELLRAKLEAYGLIVNPRLPTRRFQRVKINANSSEWKETKTGAPQGSVLGPLFSTFSLMTY